jgi:outer membrane protein OmpA-like peptidoglycan-associated protein
MRGFAIVVKRTVPWLIPLAFATGCVSAQQEAAARDQLRRAQSAFEQAQRNPNVQAHAQLQLADAQSSLEAAKRATKVEDIQHFGYLAERRSQIALTQGETKKTELDTQQLGRETNEILLQKRDREAKAARADADARARDLERARMENEARARQIEQARTQQEAQARQIEQAQRELEAQARAADQARSQLGAEARAAEQARLQAASAQTQTAALTRELSELKAKQTDRGVVLTMGDVLFATGKSDVAPGAQRSIDKLVDFLQKNPTRNVLIEGHTDNTGSADLNLRLSQERADAVKELLVAKGISPDRISARGHGLKYPLVSNDTAAGRQQNRRVEVVVLNEGVSPQSVTR